MGKKSIKQILFLVIVALALPCGLILSLILANNLIDYSLIVKINLLDSESLFNGFHIFDKWLSISLGCLLIALVLLVFYAYIKSYILKVSEETADLTLSSTIISVMVILMLSQIILPLIVVVLLVLFIILYAIFGISSLAQFLLRIMMIFSINILQSLFSSVGIKIELGDFIGQNSLSLFLSLITFFISIPYIFAYIVKGIGCLARKTSNTIINYMFRPFERVFQVGYLRGFLYIVLFLISLLTFTYNISGPSNILSIIKESLLTFVLLDTVCYSIYEKGQKRRQKKINKQYFDIVLQYKHDLEFIRSTITIFNLINKVNYKAKVKFSCEAILIKNRRRCPFAFILDELTYLSENHFTYQELYHNINNILYDIYIFEGGFLE